MSKHYYCSEEMTNEIKDLKKERDKLKNTLNTIKNILAQPIDRISHITLEDYAEIREKILQSLSEHFGGSNG